MMIKSLSDRVKSIASRVKFYQLEINFGWYNLCPCARMWDSIWKPFQLFIFFVPLMMQLLILCELGYRRNCCHILYFILRFLCKIVLSWYVTFVTFYDEFLKSLCRINWHLMTVSVLAPHVCMVWSDISYQCRRQKKMTRALKCLRMMIRAL